MINSWSELFQAIKTWFNSPLKFEKKEEEIVPLEPKTAKMINDLMAAPRQVDWDKLYFNSLPDYYRDPYYKNLKIDDSIWQDQEIKILKDHVDSTRDPVEREERKKDLIRRIRQKYGLDHP